VWVVKHDDVLAGFSRFAKRTFPWRQGTTAEQAKYLLELGERHDLKGWVLFPTSDVSADLVARHHDVLGAYYKLTTPPLEQFEIAQDKRLAYKRGECLGIEVPHTWYPESADEVAALDVEYPVILKPASGVIDNPLSHVKAWKIDDRETLLEKYAQASPFLPPGQVMIQEIIPGGGECQFSFAAACLDGEVHASLTARRTRQIPMDFGRASTYVETMDVPEIVEPSTRIIESMGLTGLVEVEFKLDPRSDKYKLLDVNSRAWGVALDRGCGRCRLPVSRVAARAGRDRRAHARALGCALGAAHHRPLGVRQGSARGAHAAPRVLEVDAAADRRAHRGQGRSDARADGVAAARPALREPGAPQASLYEGICPRHLSHGFLSRFLCKSAMYASASEFRHWPAYQTPMQPKRSPFAFSPTNDSPS